MSFCRPRCVWNNSPLFAARSASLRDGIAVYRVACGPLFSESQFTLRGGGAVRAAGCLLTVRDLWPMKAARACCILCPFEFSPSGFKPCRYPHFRSGISPYSFNPKPQAPAFVGRVDVWELAECRQRARLRLAVKRISTWPRINASNMWVTARL
jgi:hypothetical protein